MDVPHEPLERAVLAFGRRLEAEGRSPNTVSAYLRALLTLAGVLAARRPGLTLERVTSTMLDEALTDPAVTTTPDGTQRSAASLHRFKAAVRSFFAWAEETGLVAENPARSVTLRRLPRTPPVFLTEAEKRRLLKELRDRSSAVARRDRVIVELFLGTGIRLQELVSLDVDDVDLDAKHLRIRAKGDVPQVKFLKSNLRSLLRRYLAERRRQGTADPALFLSNRGTRISGRQVANRIKFWLAKAGIDKDIGPHGLRHTFATHLYAATSDLLVVKRALGHRDISTTEIYTHLVDGALEEALERL
jgi:integrase/recombinase XerC